MVAPIGPYILTTLPLSFLTARNLGFHHRLLGSRVESLQLFLNNPFIRPDDRLFCSDWAAPWVQKPITRHPTMNGLPILRKTVRAILSTLPTSPP